jgi:serine/threonine protein kinase
MSGNTLPLAPDARSLGKYEVLCRLSTGGMAEIFLASQRGLAGFRKLVVLKQILPDIRGEEEFVRMFLDEAKVTAAFNHPHIAQVYDLDIADGELFLSMEFVPGATLVEVARACRQANIAIPMGFSLMAVRDTAVALHYAHTFTDPLGQPSPVIHRDVAEKNIMVTYEGVTKLLDFGIAKSLARASRTAVGMVKGTSGYMSPEQILGEPLDARSDLFSLGVVLHECLTGMRLFYAKQAEAMMNAVLRCEVTPPSRTNKQVPPELDAIVMRALARKREDRYASTLEFARALERAVGPLIWHPEQSSELMRRLFADRREQTRQLLASGQATQGDTTSALSVARVLAMGSEPSESPAGGAQAPGAPPPPARASVSVPAVKAPATAKPATPPLGTPALKRPTLTAPTHAPPPAEEEGTVRARPPVTAPPLTAMPQKRVPPRTLSGESPRPPPPPAEAMALPPPPPEDSELAIRTQPARPALPPELLLRAQPPSAPTAPEETTSRLAPRAAPAQEPAPSAAEEPPRPRRTLEEPSRVEARPRSRTLDTVRPAPPQPPAERDLQTAMARVPTPPERDAQAAMGRAPPPPAPPERDAPSVRAPAPAMRDAQPPNTRSPAPLMRDAARASAPVPEPREESVSITPPSPSRRGRRRSAPPPPFAPPDITEPVTAVSDSDDAAGAALGDDDAHENTLRGIRAPRRERRSGMWVIVAAGLLLVLGLGTAAVLLGMDGGRVSSLLKPARAGASSPAGSKQQGPPAATASGPQVKPTSVAGPGSASVGGPTQEAPAATAPGTAAGGGTAQATPSAAAPGAAEPPTGAGLVAPGSTALAEARKTTGESASSKEAEDLAQALDEGTSAEGAPGSKKARSLPKRTKEATLARKPRAEEAPAASAEATPAGEPGFLTLVTEPYAKVFLGGQELGDTPLFKAKLPSGKHTLRLVDGNQKAFRLPVEIKPGETTAVRIPLAMLATQ